MNPNDRDGPVYWADRTLWQIKPIKQLLLAGLAWGVIWLGMRTSHVLLPVLVGLLLAYVCHPVVSSVHERLAIPRVVTSAVILALAITAWVALGMWLAPILVDQATALVERTPAYLEYLGQRS